MRVRMHSRLTKKVLIITNIFKFRHKGFGEANCGSGDFAGVRCKVIKKRSSKKKDEFKDRKSFGDAKVEVKLFFRKKTYSMNIFCFRCWFQRRRRRGRETMTKEETTRTEESRVRNQRRRKNE